MVKKTAKKPEDSKSKKSSLPARPTTSTSKTKSSGMPARRKPADDNRDTPLAQLGMAQATLTRVQIELGRQMAFRENGDWDETPFYDPLERLTAIFDEKGLVKPYDLEYDWTEFKTQVNKIGDDMLGSVAQHLKAKAERMLYTGRSSDDVLAKLWAEAEEEGEKTREIIRGFSNLIRKLHATGCYDPEEQQLRGGRQQGGNRRGRG